VGGVEALTEFGVEGERARVGGPGNRGGVGGDPVDPRDDPGSLAGAAVVLPEIDLPDVYLPEKHAQLAFLTREVAFPGDA
jgi:hypothetical protein